MTKEEALKIATAIDEDKKYDIAIELIEAYHQGFSDASDNALKNIKEAFNPTV